MAKTMILFLLAALFCSGCGLRDREESLQNREVILAQKEQQLLLKDKELSLKEERLALLEKKMDSARVDTAMHYNEQLIGLWNVKMTCIETSCSGSAVGDTKNENWEFSVQNNTLFAKAMNGSELIRTYTGKMEDNNIVLSDDIAASGSATATHMQVRLAWADGTTMDGQRDITRENNCRLVYRLQLTRQQ